MRALFIFLIISLIAEIAGYVLARNHIPNHITQNLITVTEGSFLACIYFLKFESPGLKRVIVFAYLAFIALTIYVFIKKGISRQDSFISTAEAVLIIGSSILYFYQSLNEIMITNRRQYYFMWINSGFLVYFSMALIMSIFDSPLKNFELSFYQSLYSIQLLSNVTLNVLLAIGVWKK